MGLDGRSVGGRSLVICKFLQDSFDLILDDGRKFSFTDLNHVEGSLRLVWETLLQKIFYIFLRIPNLALFCGVESDCAFNDLFDFYYFV